MPVIIWNSFLPSFLFLDQGTPFSTHILLLATDLHILCNVFYSIIWHTFFTGRLILLIKYIKLNQSRNEIRQSFLIAKISVDAVFFHYFTVAVIALPLTTQNSLLSTAPSSGLLHTHIRYCRRSSKVSSERATCSPWKTS